MNRIRLSVSLLLGLHLVLGARADDSTGGQVHGYAQSGDVRIHYVTQGQGPLLVMIHGFPDYWYTWRDLMPKLAEKFQVVAIDQRGYNRSDQPEGVDAYRMTHLVGDVEAVIQHFGKEKATILGHDWGGAVAWNCAAFKPDMVERLIILNLPHPNGLSRELKNNAAQQKASEYARRFQGADAASQLTAEGLAAWVTDSDARKKYIAAFKRSSFDGMLNYYKANFPKPSGNTQKSKGALPLIQCPVLMIHGLNDTALLPPALNDTWEWLENELTLVTLPNAGHFVQQDEPAKVARAVRSWLAVH